jgi:hypothetical protein
MGPIGRKEGKEKGGKAGRQAGRIGRQKCERKKGRKAGRKEDIIYIHRQSELRSYIFTHITRTCAMSFFSDCRDRLPERLVVPNSSLATVIERMTVVVRLGVRKKEGRKEKHGRHRERVRGNERESVRLLWAGSTFRCHLSAPSFPSSPLFLPFFRFTSFLSIHRHRAQLRVKCMRLFHQFRCYNHFPPKST